MAGSMNGALLALGVAGAVALAGRVRRGSFAHGWHGRARELLSAARDEQYVDSGDLIEVLEAILADRSVTGRPRALVVSLLLGSQDEGYLDSGEALEAIEAALGHGSRAYVIDDPEYTHYVVHVPSMKIASGWSYAEDAKEALADMGSAKAHCKVYTRKFLKDHGRDPRSNGNWASRGQF